MLKKTILRIPGARSTVRLLKRIVPPSERGMPPAVKVPFEATVREYWEARYPQHLVDSYVGVPLYKFPEDLRAYEHLIWLARPNTIIELGTYRWGSALWFRDRLRVLQSYRRTDTVRVISVDTDIGGARMWLKRADPDYQSSITLLEGDVTQAALAERVEAHLPPGARCMVVEDTAHTHATTLGALRNFARFVPVGGWFVVEDGCLDTDSMRLSETWPRGVLPAVREWLASPAGSRFESRRDLELYGLSSNPEGFLRRVAPDS